MRWRVTVGTPWSYAGLALLVCIVIHPAFAAPCTLEGAVDAIQFDDLKQEASTGPQLNELLGKLDAIAAKAKKPNVPLDTQLSADDMEEFGELRAQLIQLQDYSFTQSNRARDAEVVLDMFNVSLKTYSDPNYDPPPATELAQSPGIAVIYLRFMQPKQANYIPSTDTACTIDLALSQDQAQVFQQIDAAMPTVQRNEPALDALRAKYGVAPNAPPDPSKMTPDDALTLALLQNELRPAISDLTLSLDLSNIRAWWNVAQLVYNDDLLDSQRGDNTTDVGATLKAQQATLSPSAQELLKLWVVIDRKVPNDDTTEFQQMQTAFQQAGIPH